MKTLIKEFILNSIGYPKPSSVISLISKDFRQDNIINDILDFFILADGAFLKNNIKENKNFGIVNQWSINPVYCAIITNAATHIDTGIIYLRKSKKYIMETSSGWAKYRTHALKKYNGKKKYINTKLPVFVFSGIGFHGIVDDLSSMIGLWNKGYKFIVAINENNHWMNSLIDIFIPELKNNKLYITKNTWILSPKTISVTKSGMGEFTNHSLINILKRKSKKLNLNGVKYDKIFISRSDTNKRTYTNEKSLENKYVDKAYTPLILAEMSVEDQISAFQSASHVAGLHGAGFTNIIWAKKNLKVKEYILKNHHNSAIPVLCNYLGHSHAYQLL